MAEAALQADEVRCSGELFQEEVATAARAVSQRHLATSHLRQV